PCCPCGMTFSAVSAEAGEAASSRAAVIASSSPRSMARPYPERRANAADPQSALRVRVADAKGARGGASARPGEELRQRVDRAAVLVAPPAAHPDLEVQVRAGRAAGRADPAQE